MVGGELGETVTDLGVDETHNAACLMRCHGEGVLI
jgi:hypothetical protein